MTHRPAH